MTSPDLIDARRAAIIKAVDDFVDHMKKDPKQTMDCVRGDKIMAALDELFHCRSRWTYTPPAENVASFYIGGLTTFLGLMLLRVFWG